VKLIFFNLAYSILFLICIGVANALPIDETVKFSTSMHGEVYVQHSFRKEMDKMPEYVVSHVDLNAPALNLLLGTIAFDAQSWKGELSLMTGTYSRDNLRGENGVLKHINSMWLSYAPSKTIDILSGIYSSHIGLESPIGKDCVQPTRSIVADNSPYYQSGIRIRHQSKSTTYSLHLLNGWQRSTIDTLGVLPAIGYEYSANTEQMNYRISGFIGKTSHDASIGMRYYQHFGGTYQLHENFDCSASIDIGMQKIRETNAWVFAPLIMARWSMNNSFKMNGRLEYYHDPHGMIVNSTGGLSGFGYSMGIDWSYSNAMLFRAEWRQIHAMLDNQDVNILGIHAQWAIMNEL
jgi:hypothetical protein